jgi:hypothetical protein
MFFSKAIVDYFMGKMMSLDILLTTRTQIIPIIVCVTHTVGFKNQEYLPQW